MNFDDFYSETKDNFFKYLYYFCDDHETANDIFQESYLKIYEKYRKTPSKALLYKIGKNAFLDTKRKKREITIENEFLSSFENTVEIGNDEDNILEKVLEKLDDDTRHIFTLKIVNDMKYKEIAEITGHSEANIKVIIHRARKTLKKHFKEA